MCLYNTHLGESQTLNSLRDFTLQFPREHSYVALFEQVWEQQIQRLGHFTCWLVLSSTLLPHLG